MDVDLLPLAHPVVQTPPTAGPNPLPEHPRRSVPHRLTAAVLRLVPVAAILVFQAAESIHLMHSNTAFLDEATYLGAGHQLVHRWALGGPNLNYETYFSGAPVVYPVLGGRVDAVGGLVAARSASLVFMLLATLLAYATARRLFGTPAGWFAAATFATVEGVQFLGAFATYDAMALSLTTLACWLVVRFATADRPRPHAGIFLAAPVMALADATKYAMGAYDLAVIAVALLVVASRYGWSQGVRVGAVLGGLTAALAAALLALAGTRYLSGVTSTTLHRPLGATPPGVVWGDSVAWVGAVAVLGALAMLIAIVRARHGRMRWADAALVGVLASTVFLAPVNQMHIHTSTSLSKHVAFGAWFGALAVGYLLAGVSGRDWRDVWRFPLAAAVLVPMVFAGMHQAQRLYAQWPASGPLVTALRPLVLGTSRPVLVDDAQVPAYYMGEDVYPTRWINTFYLKYHDRLTGKDLLGPAAYTAAVRDGFFDVIAIDFGAQRSVDNAVAQAVHNNKRYHWVRNVDLTDTYGRVTYVIWQRQ